MTRPAPVMLIATGLMFTLVCLGVTAAASTIGEATVMPGAHVATGGAEAESSSTLNDKWVAVLQGAPRSNLARLRKVRTQMERGCPNVTVAPIRRSDQLNITCEISGRGAGLWIVGAHYDRIGSGSGIVDNWSGIVLLFALIEAMQRVPNEHSFQFVAFGEEETGLRGSKLFARAMPRLPGGMINIDTVGLRSVRADPRSSQDLLAIARQEAGRLGIKLTTPRVAWVDGDWRPFRAMDIPILNFHSLRRSDQSAVHTVRDQFDRINWSAYADTYTLLLAILRHLDQQQGKPAT